MVTYLVRKGVGSNPTSVIPSFFFRGLPSGSVLLRNIQSEQYFKGFSAIPVMSFRMEGG